MKTSPTISADRLELISQILGIGRGEYLGAPAAAPRRAPRGIVARNLAARKMTTPTPAAARQAASE